MLRRSICLLAFTMLFAGISVYSQDQKPGSATLQAWTYKVTTVKTFDKMKAFNAPDFNLDDLKGDYKKALEESYVAPEGWRWLAVWAEFAQPKSATPLPLAEVIAIDDAGESYRLAAVDCAVSVQQMLTWVYLSTMKKPVVMDKKEYKKRGAWEQLLVSVKQPDGEDHLKPVGLLCMFGWDVKKQILTILSGESEDDRSLTLERQRGYILLPDKLTMTVVDLGSYSDRSASPETLPASVVLLFKVKRAAKAFELQVGASSRVPIPLADTAPVTP